MKDTIIRRKIWGRRQARPIKGIQKDLMSTLLPHVRLTVTPDQKAFNLSKITWLEIGFGGGEHLATQAQRHPDCEFIGCEPFVNGVASLLQHIDEKALTNCRIVMDDARLFMETLPDHSVDYICVLFPDPWPKKRHHKRRIVNDETVKEFARLLKPGGELRLATDIEHYADWMQKAMATCPAFKIDLQGRASIHERPNDWPVTRYEQKGLEAGRPSAYMIYTKN